MKTKKIIVASLMASLVCVATMIVKIPSPLKGYLNIGDCVVLLASWTLSPGYGFLAAGLGSALADMFSGYVSYAPATFFIKGTMVLISFVCFKLMNKKTGKLLSRITGGILAEILMVIGYFIFEGFLYGFAPSVVNIPANAVQGVAGIILGIALIGVLEKANITFE